MDFILWLLYNMALASACATFITTLSGFIMAGYTPRNPLLAVNGKRAGHQIYSHILDSLDPAWDGSRYVGYVGEVRLPLVNRSLKINSLEVS